MKLQLSKITRDILSNFSKINSNLVIRKGKKVATISSGKDIIAYFDGDDEFTAQMSIFNLNEFLGVLSAFDNPDLELQTKYVTITQGKQKVSYIYADESLLILPPEKEIKFPVSDISFSLDDDIINKLQKMSGILAAEDLAVVGNSKKIVLKVFNKSNPSATSFELETDVDTDEEFQVNFKIEKLKLYPGNYTVDISNKKISRFAHDSGKLVYFIAIEADSVFSV